MAAAVTPEPSEVCAEVCGHAGCEAVRHFVAIPCVLCGEPMGYAAEFLHQVGWRLLGHRACVLADLDTWERIRDEVSTS
ncbi:MAG: hypothetical protein ACRDYA_06870 [Egibacteraceae bacterium]